MTAKVGFPTLRLIRNSIEGIGLDHLQPGEMMSMNEKEVYRQLFEQSH